jgi:lysophospholipase L1-like esterase
MNKFIAIIFSAIVAEVSCTEKSMPIVAVQPTPTVVTKTYLALGDSYTIGQGVAADQRFPIQTMDWLFQNGIRIENPKIVATTGWTTLALQNAINTQTFAPKYDVVSLLIGVNDQYTGVDTNTYRTRFTQLLQKSITLADNKVSHVFVLSIPDYSVTPFVDVFNKPRVSREIDWFNNINKSITQAYGCQYLDITPSTRMAATNRALIASDSLHPSGLEYKKWAERLGPMMKQELQ